MNLDQVQVPILLLAPNNSIEVVRDKKVLTTTNKLGYKNKTFLNNILIDVNGIFYRTVGAKKIRNKYPFWKFEFFNPAYEIDINIEEIPPKEFTLFKQKVTNTVLSDFQFWSFQNKNDAVNRLSATSSFQDLIELLVKYSS